MLAYNNRKFDFCFPLFSWSIRNPIFYILFAFFGSVSTVFFSLHYTFSILVVSLAGIFFYLEGPLAKKLIFSPFLLLIAYPIIRYAVAVPMLVWDNGGERMPGFFEGQIAGIIFLVFAFFGYRMVIPQGTDIELPMDDSSFRRKVVKPLVVFGLACLAYALLSTIVLLATGARDRGLGSEVGSRYGVFGWVSVFQVFARFKLIGYLLVPLAFRNSDIVAKTFIVSAITASMGLSVLNGDRGNVLWPILAMGTGYFIFINHVRFRIERIALLSVIPIIAFLYVVDVYRNLDLFEETSAMQIGERLSALTTVNEGIANAEMELEFKGIGQSFLGVTGGRLWGGFDHLIFEMTPDVFPYVGFQNFKSLPLVWIPFSVGGNVGQAQIFGDGFIIASIYRGVFHENARYGISLVADLYRRFGWLWLPVACFLVGILYGFLWRGIFIVFRQKDPFLGVMLILLMFTILFGKSYSTVMGSWKVFAYDIPKHFIIVFLYWFIYVRKLRLS